MRTLSGVSVLLGALMVGGMALALASVGCGDDTEVTDAEVQNDVTSDQTVSVDGGSDAHTDAKVTDAKHDTGKHDASSDVQSDTTEDVMEDVTDSGTDAKDAKTPSDAATDAAELYAFPNSVNTAYCTRLKSCCNTDYPDAGPFTLASCISSTGGSGGVANVSLANVHGGHITLDPTAAAACIADQAKYTCTPATNLEAETDTEVLNSLRDCSNAMVGTLTSGDGPCTSAWECEGQAYCAGTGGVPIDTVYNADGTVFAQFISDVESTGTVVTGTCAPLRTVGESCTDFYNSSTGTGGQYNSGCSHLGNGTSFYCSQTGTSDAGTCAADPPPGTTNASSCNFNTDCTTGICDPNQNYLCSTTGVFDGNGEFVMDCSYP
jgi:hypothetical protein